MAPAQAVVNVARVTYPGIRVPEVDDRGRMVLDSNTGRRQEVPLTFRMQAPSEADFTNACRGGNGDPLQVTQRLVYALTVPPDKARLWDNAAIQQHCGARNGLAVVGVLLASPSELCPVLGVISELLRGEASRLPVLLTELQRGQVLEAGRGGR